MTSSTKGSLAASISGFLYGFVAYFGLTVIHSGMSIAAMTFWRFAIASLVMLIILLPRISKIRAPGKEVRLVFINSSLFYGSSTILYFIACHYISSGLAMVLLFTYPVMVILINAMIYKQTIEKVYYISALVILIGMALMVDAREVRSDLTGVLIMLLSALAYACYIISSKKSSLAPDLSTLIVSLGCMTTAFLYGLVDHSLTVPKQALIWLDLIGVGIVSTTFAVMLMLYGLRYISSERASILSVFEPVFVVIIGILLLGEQLSLIHAFGVILVLGGALFTLFTRPAEEHGIPAALPLSD